MSDWIDVDVNAMNQEVRKDIQGVKVKISFSPYDVPRQYRSYRDTETNNFIVEFKYLLDEETISEKPSADAPFEFEIGENSKRIYKIKIDTKAIKCDAVDVSFGTLAQNIVNTIETFKKSVPQKLQDRYKMPEDVILNHRNELFSELVAA